MPHPDQADSGQDHRNQRQTDSDEHLSTQRSACAIRGYRRRRDHTRTHGSRHSGRDGGAEEVFTSGTGLAAGLAATSRTDPAIGFLEQGGDRLRILLLLGELDECRGAPDQVELDDVPMKSQVSQGCPGVNRDPMVFQAHQDDD